MSTNALPSEGEYPGRRWEEPWEEEEREAEEEQETGPCASCWAMSCRRCPYEAPMYGEVRDG